MMQIIFVTSTSMVTELKLPHGQTDIKKMKFNGAYARSEYLRGKMIKRKAHFLNASLLQRMKACE